MIDIIKFEDGVASKLTVVVLRINQKLPLAFLAPPTFWCISRDATATACLLGPNALH